MDKMDAISDWFFGWPFAVLIVLLFLVMVSIFGRSKTKPGRNVATAQASRKAAPPKPSHALGRGSRGTR